MGMIEVFRDLFEIGRKTKTDVKSNKPEKRNYNFEDLEKMPRNQKEYKKTKM